MNGDVIVGKYSLRLSLGGHSFFFFRSQTFPNGIPAEDEWEKGNWKSENMQSEWGTDARRGIITSIRAQRQSVATSQNRIEIMMERISSQLFRQLFAYFFPFVLESLTAFWFPFDVWRWTSSKSHDRPLVLGEGLTFPQLWQFSNDGRVSRLCSLVLLTLTHFNQHEGYKDGGNVVNYELHISFWLLFPQLWPWCHIWRSSPPVCPAPWRRLLWLAKMHYRS